MKRNTIFWSYPLNNRLQRWIAANVIGISASTETACATLVRGKWQTLNVAARLYWRCYASGVKWSVTERETHDRGHSRVRNGEDDHGSLLIHLDYKVRLRLSDTARFISPPSPAPAVCFFIQRRAGNSYWLCSSAPSYVRWLSRARTFLFFTHSCLLLNSALSRRGQSGPLIAVTEA